MVAETRAACLRVGREGYAGHVSLIEAIRSGTYVATDYPSGPPPGPVSTLAQASGRIVSGDDLLVVVREFLDQIPRLSAPELASAIEERPDATGDARADALLGAIAEHVAATVDRRAPRWAAEPERFLERFWFVSRVPGFRAISLAQTPVALKRRGILWPARSLTRV